MSPGRRHRAPPFDVRPFDLALSSMFGNTAVRRLHAAWNYRNMIRTLTAFLSLPLASIAAAEPSANALVVEAAQAMASVEGAAPDAALDALAEAAALIDRIIAEHPDSDAAVALVTGQGIGTLSRAAVEQRRSDICASAPTACETEAPLLLAARRAHDAAADTAPAQQLLAAVILARNGVPEPAEVLLTRFSDAAAQAVLLAALGRDGEADRAIAGAPPDLALTAMLLAGRVPTADEAFAGRTPLATEVEPPVAAAAWFCTAPAAQLATLVPATENAIILRLLARFGAGETLMTVPMSEGAEWTWANAAMSAARYGHRDLAVELAEMLADPVYRSIALAHAGEPGRAIDMLHGETGKTPKHLAEAHIAAAEGSAEAVAASADLFASPTVSRDVLILLARSGAPEEALRLAPRVGFGAPNVFEAIGGIVASASADDALRLAETLTDPGMKAHFLIGAALALEDGHDC